MHEALGDFLRLYATHCITKMVLTIPMWAPDPGRIVSIGWDCLVLEKTKLFGVVAYIEARLLLSTILKTGYLGRQIREMKERLPEASQNIQPRNVLFLLPNIWNF